MWGFGCSSEGGGGQQNWLRLLRCPERPLLHVLLCRAHLLARLLRHQNQFVRINSGSHPHKPHPHPTPVLPSPRGCSCACRAGRGSSSSSSRPCTACEPSAALTRHEPLLDGVVGGDEPGGIVAGVLQLLAQRPPKERQSKAGLGLGPAQRGRQVASSAHSLHTRELACLLLHVRYQ